MRGSNGYPPPPPPPRGSYDGYGGASSGGPSGHGQMVINMKTTVTTSGGHHNGLVVHSAVQSAASPSTSSQNSWLPTYSESSSRRLNDQLEMMRSNTSLHRSSPLPIQMVPSTSRESLVSIGARRPPREPPRPPSPPPSPIYSFKGRDSPPDEFIQPTKLVLNVFRPQSHQDPIWQTPISRSQVTHSPSSGGIQLSKKNALLNDAVTTTTTVEVFRAPMNPNDPLIALSASPYGGTPLLIRANGPQYEQWNDRRTQPMLGDEMGMMNGGGREPKGVQWKERLIEESDRRYRDSNSDYDEIAPIAHEPPHYIHHDYRPKPSFQPVTHPMIMSTSREDLRSQPPPYPAPTSPLYIVPDRHRSAASPGQYSRRSNGSVYDEESRRDNQQNQDRERYHRRSKSSTRDDVSRHRSTRHRSFSPASRRSFGGSQEFVIPAHSPIGSTLMLASPDPNELPGRPASARSQEIFALYQTRDLHNRIVDQLEYLMEQVIDELEMIASPLAESEDSLISEMSTRNDVARASWLEYRGVRRRLEDGNESDFEDNEQIYGAPPLPERDYSRLRPLVYRKRGEEFPMRRSKSYDRPKPVRPRTPERKSTRTVIEKSKKNHVYATPIRRKKVEPAIIEEFVEEVPRYVRPMNVEKEREKEDEEEKEEEEEREEPSGSPAIPTGPVIDLSTEVEFSSKVDRGKLAREDSLTSLLKKQFARKERVLPEYVEPKDPIIRELQEFLNIEPKAGNSQNSTSNSINSNGTAIEEEDEEITENTQTKPLKAVEANEHRLIVRGWQELLKSSSSSTTSSTSSTTV